MNKETGKKPNILLIGIDSLLSTHMGCYGYHLNTTPHLDLFAKESVLFENTFSAHIPTTPGYASMLSGRDCFGTGVVALRHKGPLGPDIETLPEVLNKNGYNTTCIGFTGNPASRGFDNYLDYSCWGSLEDGRLPKAGNLNEVAIPEIERLNNLEKPFFLMLRHMDPHSPYLPPEPWDRMFYYGNECDPENRSMDPVLNFKPFRDYLATWMPEGISDKDYLIAQYDGAIGYMDSCIQRIFTQLRTLDILENTIVVINSDHGETLYDHECWFDHHGIYDNTLKVPLIIRYPDKLPSGKRLTGFNQQKDLMPTLLELADIKTELNFDGKSLLQLVKGVKASFESSFYITECTWMRKHGWRTPEWKLIRALEPDFHFKDEVELFNLVEDPSEDYNLAAQNPEMVEALTKQMVNFIQQREEETGRPNPLNHQEGWHGVKGIEYFKTSEEAYENLHIGSASKAAQLQANSRK